MSRAITDLYPDLQQPCTDFFDQCKNSSLNAFMIFTWRSPEEQDQLYAEGRTLPGKIVTNLTGSQSLHCFTIDGNPASKAFDFGLEDENKNYIIDGTDPRYEQAGEIAEGLGLVWGGRFVHPRPDYDHIQLKEGT